MARIVLLRTIEPAEGGGAWLVTEAGHDTQTRADYGRTYQVGAPPQAYNLDPSTLAGTYCAGTTRISIYHAALDSGISRLESEAGHAACALPPAPEPAPTTGLTLLWRQVEGINAGDILRTEIYYNAATRATEQRGPYAVTAPGPTFSLPRTTRVDGWCLDPGQPPFRERQVYHAGEGLLRLVDVDGVTACRPPDRPPFTLELIETTVETARGGDGSLSVRPVNAVGAVRYSLDGFAATAQDAGLFTGLPAGVYLVSGREERREGRTATLSVTITAARGVRYRLPAVSFQGRSYEARLLLRGYEGEPETLTGSGASAIHLDYPGSATDHVTDLMVRGSSLELAVLVTRPGQLLDALCRDERAMRVELWEEDVLHWRGYLQPDLYDEAHLSPPYSSTLRATDGLGGWAGVPFADPAGHRLRGRWSQRQVLTHCLRLTDCALNLYTSVSLYEEQMAAGAEDDPLEQVYVDLAGYQDSKGEPWSCLQVAEAILRPYGAHLLQADGAWHLRRLTEVAQGLVPRRGYSSEGVRLAAVAPAAPVLAVTQPGEALWWIGATQRLTARPPVASVKLTTSPGELINLLPDAGFPALSFSADGLLRDWTGTAPHRREESVRDTAALRLLGLQLAPDGGITPEEEPSAFLTTPSISTPADSYLVLQFTMELEQAGEWDVFAPDAPRLLLAYEVDGQWLRPFLEGPQATPYLEPIIFEKGYTPQAVVIGYQLYTGAAQRVRLRFYQPQTKGDVILRDLRLNHGLYGGGEPGNSDRYTDIYRTENLEAGRLTIQDDDTVLQHVETPLALLARTPLRADGSPALAWRQEAGGPLYELGDFLIRDRLRWQITYAQVLTGTLRGVFSPLATLYESAGAPGVYLPTALTWDVLQDRWEVTAVELIGAALPDAAGETFRLLLESGGALLLESGDYFLLENHG